MATSSRSARTEAAAMNSGSPVILNRWGAIHVRRQMFGRMRAPGNDVHALFVVIVGVRCCRLSGSERCAGLPECSSCSCTSMRLQTYAPPNFHCTSCSRRICTPLHSHTHTAADAAACPSAPTPNAVLPRRFSVVSPYVVLLLGAHCLLAPAAHVTTRRRSTASSCLFG